MRELRRLEAEALVEQDVLRRRADPLLTAHDVRDAHLVVVDDHGEVVRRETVGLHDDLIVRAGRLDLASDEVVEHERRVVGDEHAHDGVLAEAGLGGALLTRLAVAHAVVAGRQLLLLLELAHLGEPLARAVAVVGLALVDELVDVRLVRVEPLTLTVRRVRAADVGALVPVQVEPVQRVEDLLLGIGLEARPVGVLDAQDELSALLTRERKVEHRHVGGADVRVTRRRRRDAQTDGAGARLAGRRGGGG